jgi:hypothetical protein
VILDPEPIGGDAGIGIDAGLKCGGATDQILGGGMAVMVGDILAQPAPQRLDRHQVRAVAGQRRQVDVQACRSRPNHLGTMIGRPVPEHDQRARRDLGAQPAQHVDGVIAVGPLVGPDPHRPFVVERQAIERDLGLQAGRG